MQTVFTVMFVIYNTLLASLIVDNQALNFALTLVTWTIVMVSIIVTSFDFDEFSLQASTVMTISVLYVCILVPGFILITNTINEEIIAEARESYMDRDNFKRMFDALQEGIIVLQGNSINMMNDLSNRVLSEMTNMHDFFMKREKTGEKSLENLLDKKLFFLFVGAGSGTKKDKKNAKKKKGKGTSSDFSRHTPSTNSADEKMEYSIRDFQ